MTDDLAPIGTVVALLRLDHPDISHSSLRFLEREGLIAPVRTPGGHRLYSPDDVRRVRQIKDWQAQRLSLEEIRGRLHRLAALAAPAAMADAFLEPTLRGDLPAARRVILDGDALGLPLDVSFIEVLGPALRELGDRWERGVVSVAQEKEGSEVARELIAELNQRHAPADAASGGHVVAACVAGEAHDLGLRMVSGLLRSRGVAVHFLGPDVSPAFLVDAVQRRRAAAVLLSATTDDRLPALDAAVAALSAAGRPPPVFAGGQAVARHADAVRQFGVTPLGDDEPALADVLRAVRGA